MNVIEIPAHNMFSTEDVFRAISESDTVYRVENTDTYVRLYTRKNGTTGIVHYNPVYFGDTLVGHSEDKFLSNQTIHRDYLIPNLPFHEY